MCPIWTNLQPKTCFEYDQKEFPNVFAMIYTVMEIERLSN